MTPTARTTPAEFGDALKGARSAAGLTLEAISERTKIPVRSLAALESGDLGRLPDRTFARMFLRQYLEIVGVTPADWLKAFDGLWRQFDEASHPRLAVSAIPMRKSHRAPWVIGVVLVAAAVAAVVLFAGRPHLGVPRGELPGAEGAAAARPPGPAAPTAAPALPPVAPVAAATAAPAEGPAPGTLVVRTDRSACWVEVRVAGEAPASRLLPPDTTWTVDAAGRQVDLVLGDAGAASVEYMGEVRRPAGAPGAVARLHFEGARSGESAR